eukprot:1189101-Rhodomonas_salina.1
MLVAWGVLTYGHAARRSTNRRGRLSSQGTRYAICLSSITLRPLLYNATLFSYAISAICLRPLLCITLRYFPTRSLLSAYDLSSILRYAIVLRTLRYYPTTYPLSSYAIVLRAPRYRPTYSYAFFSAISLRARSIESGSDLGARVCTRLSEVRETRREDEGVTGVDKKGTALARTLPGRGARLSEMKGVGAVRSTYVGNAGTAGVSGTHPGTDTAYVGTKKFGTDGGYAGTKKSSSDFANAGTREGYGRGHAEAKRADSTDTGRARDTDTGYRQAMSGTDVEYCSTISGTKKEMFGTDVG